MRPKSGLDDLIERVATMTSACRNEQHKDCRPFWDGFCKCRCHDSAPSDGDAE